MTRDSPLEDIPALANLADAIHRHGALAAIELVHAGMNALNLYSYDGAILAV